MKLTNANQQSATVFHGASCVVAAAPISQHAHALDVKFEFAGDPTVQTHTRQASDTSWRGAERIHEHICVSHGLAKPLSPWEFDPAK